MNYSLEDLYRMTDAELDKVIDEDAGGDAQLAFDLEAELLSLLHDAVFPHSETFGDPDAETRAERTVRVLAESLDFRSTLGAISASPKSSPIAPPEETSGRTASTRKEAAKGSFIFRKNPS